MCNVKLNVWVRHRWSPPSYDICSGTGSSNPTFHVTCAGSTFRLSGEQQAYRAPHWGQDECLRQQWEKPAALRFHTKWCDVNTNCVELESEKNKKMLVSLWDMFIFAYVSKSLLCDENDNQTNVRWPEGAQHIWKTLERNKIVSVLFTCCCVFWFVTIYLNC